MKENTKLFPEGYIPFELLSGKDPHTPMLIALSGGADSRMLFELARRHCELHRSRFYACHVNHGIRGEEALRDRDFCVSLAKECPQCEDIFVLNADVPTLAEASGMSIEHQARNTRYEFFGEIMEKHSIPILVTAHNADDNLETLIFNLVRGSGVRGMRGIPKSRPFGKGILIRPMLNISKESIIGFCLENTLTFVTDSTNSDTDYTRNLIRAQIVPLLERINPAVRGSASRLSASMSELCSLTDGQAEDFLNGSAPLSLKKLSKADPRLLPHILSLAAERSGIDAEAVHLEALCRLCDSRKDGAAVSLPSATRAVIYGDSLCFEYDTGTPDACPQFDIPLKEGEAAVPGGTVKVSYTESGAEIRLSLSPNCEKCVNNKNVYKLDINAHIIFDTIRYHAQEMRLRNRVSGDRILSGGVRKSVKKLMCDKKLPVAVRNTIPMLCLGDDILWIPNVASADKIKCLYL